MQRINRKRIEERIKALSLSDNVMVETLRDLLYTIGTSKINLGLTRYGEVAVQVPTRNEKYVVDNRYQIR